MKYIKIILLFALLLIPLASWSHEGETHSQDKQEPAQKTQTLKGHIIGLTCFLKHNAKGPNHKSCAIECAEKGLPLGLSTQDGKIYQIMGKGHADLKTVNATLKDYVEEDVIVVGEVFENQGMQAIVIEKIKKQ